MGPDLRGFFPWDTYAYGGILHLRRVSPSGSAAFVAGAPHSYIECDFQTKASRFPVLHTLTKFYLNDFSFPTATLYHHYRY